MRNNCYAERLGRAYIWGIVALIIAVVAGFVIWQWLAKPRPRQVTPEAMLAAIQANNRGIGLLEQFEYAKAADAFEETVKFAPDWPAGQINLGIALLNTVDKSKPQ